jgi:hypothetical protein
LEWSGVRSQKACCHPWFELFALQEVRLVIRFLTLVAAESTTELLLALGTLVHEATGALGAAEAASTLRGHAEATETGLHSGRGLTVPGSRRRLVAELAERSGGWMVLAVPKGRG